MDFCLFVAAIYDLIFSRRAGGDPTVSHRDPTGDDAITFNNPAFKEKRSMNPSKSITKWVFPKDFYFTTEQYRYMFVVQCIHETSRKSTIKY